MEDIINNIDSVVKYFAECSKNNDSFIPEYENSNKILKILRNTTNITKHELTSIIEILNNMSMINHYNGSGWHEFTILVNSLIRKYSYELEWENDLVRLIKIDSVEQIMEKKMKGIKSFYYLRLEDEQNFEKKDLSDLIFLNSNFTGRFKKCNLTNTYFYKCDLTNSDFSEAILVNVTMRNCILKGVKFQDANLTNFKTQFCVECCP